MELDIAQVYLLLHAGPALSADEIAEGLVAEVATVQRCLQLLGKLDLLRPSETPGKFTVVRSDTGMTMLLTRAEAQAARATAAAGADRTGTSARVTREAMSDREWDVLQLLAQGYTDETVARNLGVSLRTARRVAADLMGRLGARSRFQAGLMASKVLAERAHARTDLRQLPHGNPLHRRFPHVAAV